MREQRCSIRERNGGSARSDAPGIHCALSIIQSSSTPLQAFAVEHHGTREQGPSSTARQRP